MFKRHFFRGRKTTTPIFLFMLLFSFAFLLGCTNGDVITMPFTESQFYSRTTDLNYSLFIQGEYDGLCLAVDNNKLSVVECGSGGSGFVNPAIEDLNMNNFDIVDVNGIYGTYFWNDLNKSYGILYCNDGNIFMGYIKNEVC